MSRVVTTVRPTVDCRRLRHMLTVQKKTETRDALGGVVETWADAEDGDTYGLVEPVGSAEFQAVDATSASITHRITMRYWEGLTQHHRIRFGSRTFAISAPPINPEEQDRIHVVQCMELV